MWISVGSSCLYAMKFQGKGLCGGGALPQPFLDLQSSLLSVVSLVLLQLLESLSLVT